MESVLEVLGFEVAMLVVAVRLFERVRRGVEDICGLLEDVVHLLKRAVASLGVEEVDNWEDERVARIVS